MARVGHWWVHNYSVVLANAGTHNPGERLWREAGNSESWPNRCLWL
ncbi:hypothetical protein ACVWY3_005926 [Bradyrhizobium sp. USDA 4486]